jgi:circadian clock protein KaiB
MTTGMRKKTRDGGTKTPKYHFLLFIAGEEPNSVAARSSLEKICSTYLEQDCHVEIIDVLEDFRPALKESVWVTPALVITEPGPRTVIFGNLSDTQQVLSALKVAT